MNTLSVMVTQRLFESTYSVQWGLEQSQCRSELPRLLRISPLESRNKSKLADGHVAQMFQQSVSAAQSLSRTLQPQTPSHSQPYQP
jgi:hypothetical protein